LQIQVDAHIAILEQALGSNERARAFANAYVDYHDRSGGFRPCIDYTVVGFKPL
jgi:hypothetical protein